MKISVECGARNRYDSIKEAVLGMGEGYQFLGMDPANPISMIFENDQQPEDIKLAIMKVEKAIKGTRYGKITSFRVVPYGQIVFYK